MNIVNGEVNQLFSSRCNTSKEDYYRRIYAKTASLFETSTHTAGIISQIPSQQVELLRKFGYELGMAFQIVDDILDYRGDQAVIGKPVGGDLRQGLFTLPILCYMENHPEDKNIINILNSDCSINETAIHQLVSDVANSSAIENSMSEARLFCERANQCLMQLPDSPERAELIQITTYIVDRDL
jgi:geranylgeranyl pyrophosphate synthase